MVKKVAEPSISGPTSPTPDTPSLVPSAFNDGQPLPKLIIFDLDYTLWPFWVDTHVTPPLKGKDNNTRAVDRLSESFTFYPLVPALLQACAQASIPLALASRTHAPDLAISLLKLLQIPTTSTQLPTSAPASPTKPTLLPSLSKSPPSSRRALDFFAHTAIFPGDKRTHMAKLQKASGVGFEDMLFFDDEGRNQNVEGLGVVFWLVREGVSGEEVDKGVREWRRRRGII